MTEEAPKMTPRGILAPGHVLTTDAVRDALEMGQWAFRKFLVVLEKLDVHPIKIGRQYYFLSDEIIGAFRFLSEKQKNAAGELGGTSNRVKQKVF